MDSENENISSILPIEILQLITSYLDFDDLLNLADTNKFLWKIVLADLRFTQRHRLELTLANGSCQFIVLTQRLRIMGFRYILKFLRLFNKEITFINFNAVLASEVTSLKIMEYISLYAVNAREIIFDNVKYDLSRTIMRPLVNVTKIGFQSSVLSRSMCHLSRDFPNVRVISLYLGTHVNNRDAFFGKYEKLRLLHLSSTGIDSEIHSLYFSNFQNLNPHVSIWVGTQRIK